MAGADGCTGQAVRIATLATALGVDPTAVKAFAAGLALGVELVNDATQFRDEDFEANASVRGISRLDAGIRRAVARAPWEHHPGRLLEVTMMKPMAVAATHRTS
jgi:hypothetical protein